MLGFKHKMDNPALVMVLLLVAATGYGGKPPNVA